MYNPKKRKKIMASLEKALTKDLFENLLPTYGNTRKAVPVWDESQKMFLLGNYESASGHYYYEGIRFCDRIVIKEKVGLYHTWTYIDSIEIYAFNGTKLQLVQKRDYDKTFRNEAFVRSESEQMICDFITSSLNAQGISADDTQIRNESHSIVDGSYQSFISPNFNKQLTRILPQINA